LRQPDGASGLNVCPWYRTPADSAISDSMETDACISRIRAPGARAARDKISLFDPVVTLDLETLSIHSDSDISYCVSRIEAPTRFLEPYEVGFEK